jgi:hypothetical protein
LILEIFFQWYTQDRFFLIPGTGIVKLNPVIMGVCYRGETTPVHAAAEESTRNITAKSDEMGNSVSLLAKMTPDS